MTKEDKETLEMFLADGTKEGIFGAVGRLLKENEQMLGEPVCIHSEGVLTQLRRENVRLLESNRKDREVMKHTEKILSSQDAAIILDTLRSRLEEK